MKKIIRKFLLVLSGLIMFAFVTNGQTLNMNKYVDIRVSSVDWISLKLAADTMNVPIRVVSGIYDTTLIIHNNWSGTLNFHAQDSIMRIYGNVAKLDCDSNYNKITGLNFTHNNVIRVLRCNNNSIDNLNTNTLTYLMELDCSYNLIPSLNLTILTVLRSLDCSNNFLTSLDVSGLNYLMNLKCERNSIVSINAIYCNGLRNIYCADNQLSSCALDSIFHSLPTLSSNIIGKSYIKNNTLSNPGTSSCRDTIATNRNWNVLDYNNGNGDLNIVNSSYSCTNFNGVFPQLDTSYSIKLKVQQDEWIRMYFLAEHRGTQVRVTSGTNDTLLIADTSLYYPIWSPNLNYQSIYFYSEDTIITITGKIIGFDCDLNYNKVKGLDVSNNDSLKYLHCDVNDISSLDISNLVNLELLDCFYNPLYTLNLSGLTKIKYLNCSANHLSELDITDQIELEHLWCYHNFLTSLDLSNNTNLQTIDCYYNSLKELDFTGLNNLNTIHCNNNLLSSLNVCGLNNLESLDCKYNKLTSLDVSNLGRLKSFSCNNNLISSINIFGCDSLTGIYCFGNNLSACGIDSIFQNLNPTPVYWWSIIFIKNVSETNPGTSSCRDTIATNRNWYVMDWNNGNGYIDIINTNYSCSTQSIEDVIPNNVVTKVYPNPVRDELVVECDENIENLELFDSFGRKLIVSNNCSKSTKLDVSKIKSGIYILKLQTSKGKGEYKIVKGE